MRITSEDDIRNVIMKKARENDIPVAPEQIKVQKVANDVTVSVDYTVHIDMPVYPLDLKFHAGTKNKGI